MRTMKTLLAAALVTVSAHAGPLAPPPGPVSDTFDSLGYKTLQQVEPRTPITGVTTITEPGSYYLTGDISSAGWAIDVVASHVTIDLNGFSLIGPGPDSGVNTGIRSLTPSTNIRVKNGFVRDWGVFGVGLGNCDRVTLEHVKVQNCGNSGANLGDHALVLDCVFVNNGNHGLDVSSFAVIERCTADLNDTEGIEAGNQCVIRGCVATNNGVKGIDTGTTCVVDGCVAAANADDGIEVSLGSVVSRCTAASNMIGIETAAGSLVVECAAYQNGFHGISVENDCRVIGNVCDGNGLAVNNGAGVFCDTSDTVIDGNTCTDNDYGVRTFSVSLVIRNTCSGNTVDNFDLDILTRSGGVVSAGTGVFTTDQPFTNIEY